MTSKLRLLGVVLCGGKSIRMGTDKSNLKHKSGMTFLRHSYDRLTNVCEQVIVSSDRPVPDYITIVDPVANRGPAVGVAAAVRRARDQDYDACVVTPVDMPDLSANDLIELKTTWSSNPNRLTCGISGDDHQLQPLVAIYPVSYAAELEELARSEHRSLFRWIKNKNNATVTLPHQSCRNVNSPEDL